MMIDLSELERLEKAATPGPWEEYMEGLFNRQDGNLSSLLFAIADNPLSNEAEFRDTGDAKLAAALRNAAPELLAFVREACELLACHPGHTIKYTDECVPNCSGCAWESRCEALLARVKLG